MRTIALALISLYQRHVSPLKGFRCAFRAHTGCPSCSALGYRAIRMKGLLPGLVILRARLYRCGVAYRRYGSRKRRAPLSQRGDCDFGCIDLPCDGDFGTSPGTGKSGLCEAARCLDVANCDWPTRDPKKRKGKSEDEVHLPGDKR